MGTPKGKSILGIKPKTAMSAANKETKAIEREGVCITGVQRRSRN
jgi:hypothetical protein